VSDNHYAVDAELSRKWAKAFSDRRTAANHRTTDIHSPTSERQFASTVDDHLDVLDHRPLVDTSSARRNLTLRMSFPPLRFLTLTSQKP
jgi:hypothetical protein